MRKVVLLLLLLPTAIFAQKSICGVDFGSSYSDAERILENKFGDKSYLYSDKTTIAFMDKTYAGIYWSTLWFMFQSNGYQSYLNRCILVIDCKTAEEAREKRDKIYSQMCDKYFIKDIIDEKTGFKVFFGGENPTNPEKHGFCIDIIKYGNSNLPYKYGVRLDYGPYNYVVEEL